ncbi:MAG: transporter [Candidatus Rokubacteria bacterium 13_1_40CM_69_27]|nr:MAG: transporter [Candidatus Rokubacteria bacterium 13_1_40CM_69_27]OLC37665.1 MAG: transporter [Candidatus Rokubacteria bacterium 13_1_40CM_4_69_5]
MLPSVLYGFSVSLHPQNLAACFVGVFIGTLIGVLPGIGPVATMSILFPVTYAMSPTASIIMMAGIYYGAMYGGSTTSILANIPGEAASVVTCLDGYQMARQGLAGPALGIAAFGSFIGGTASVLGIMLLGPPLASVALRFGPPEIFGLLVLGFTMVTYLAGASKLKAVAMALLGLFLGTVGLDPLTATPRFTYGSITLMDGLGLVPIIMGLFGITEVLLNVERGVRQEVFKAQIKGLLPTRQQWKESAAPIARGSFLGFFLGILPGIGAIIPTFLSYALEKRISRHPERFGAGAIEGVAAPESANNAATGGSMIPLLTLGIPPNVVMAVLLGAFLVHGIQPGPLLIKEHPEIFWGVITSMYVGNVMLLVLNLPLIGLWVQLLKIPYGVLFPLILLFCIIGVYTVSTNVWDVIVMLAFGGLGYLMKKFEYEPMPLVLAFVLGRLAEESIRQSLLLSRGSVTIFLVHPIAAGFLGAALLVVLLPLVVPRLRTALQMAGALGGT